MMTCTGGIFRRQVWSAGRLSLIVNFFAVVVRASPGTKFCLRMVRWFFTGFSGFRPPLMNDQIDMCYILERAVKPKSKNKKKKEKMPVKVRK